MPTLRDRLRTRQVTQQLHEPAIRLAKKRHEARQRALNDPTGQTNYRTSRWVQMANTYAESKAITDEIRTLPDEGKIAALQTTLPPDQIAGIERRFDTEYAGYVQTQEVKEFLTRRAAIAQGLFEQYKMLNPDDSDQDAYSEMHRQLITYGFQPKGLEQFIPFRLEDGRVHQDDSTPVWSEVKNAILGTLRGGRRLGTSPLELGIGALEMISDIHNRNRVGAEVTGSNRFRDGRREFAGAMGAVEQLLAGDKVPYGFDVAGIIGEQVPNLLATVTGAGMIRAGAQIAGSALSMGSMFALEGASAYNSYQQSAQEQGLDPRLVSARAFAGAMAYGAASAALERAIPVQVFQKIPLLKNRVIAWGLGSLAEGTTEFLQSMTEAGIGEAINLGQFDWNAVRGAMREAAAGIIVGGVAGATIMGRAAPQVDTPPDGEKSLAPPWEISLGESLKRPPQRTQRDLYIENAVRRDQGEPVIQPETGEGAVEDSSDAVNRALTEIVETPRLRPEGRLPRLRAAWRKALRVPADLVQKIPAEHPIGRLRDSIGRGLSDEYGRPAEWVKGWRTAKGQERSAQFAANKLGQTWTTSLQKAGLDPDSRDLHMAAEMALRGEIPLDTLPESVRVWVRTARTLLDTESMAAARVHRAAGLEQLADVYEGNVGKYLKNIPLARVQTGAQVKNAIRSLLGLRTTEAFRKVKRDKWLVWDGTHLVGKFNSEQDARNAYDETRNKRKSEMITQRAAKRGVSSRDLYAKAVGKVRLEKPIPLAWRAEYEVHDPRYLLAKSLIETRHDAEMINLFNTVAQKWGQAVPKGLGAAEATQWAKANNLVALPESGRLHNLGGMYVPKSIAADLTGLVRLPKLAERAYMAYLSAWKSSKTLWNPATHARNIYGNILCFSYLADCSILNPANSKFYLNGLGSLLKQDSDYQFLIESGVLGTEYYGGELQRIETQLRKADPTKFGQVLAGIKSAQKNLGALYAAEDQIFKLAAYKKYTSEGLSPDVAAEEVNKWFPNYERTGLVTRWLRKSPVGAPFISFVDQSVRIAKRAVVERPLRIATLAALPGILNYASALAIGLSPDEKELIDKERSYFEPLMPWRNERGSVQTLDLRYIMPLANDLVPENRRGMLLIPWMFSGPAAVTVVEQISGREMFTGRELIRDDMSATEQVAIRAEMIARSAIPHPSIAYWGTKRIIRSITGEREEPVAHAIIGSLAGLNIRSPYIAERHVRQIAQNMIADNALREASILVDVWNERYKPGHLKNLKLKSLAIGLKQSRLAQWRSVRDEAAEALLLGRESEAHDIIDEYTADLEQGMRPLFKEGVEYRAREMRMQGKTR